MLILWFDSPQKPLPREHPLVLTIHCMPCPQVSLFYLLIIRVGCEETFYITPDGHRLWCNKCYRNFPPELTIDGYESGGRSSYNDREIVGREAGGPQVALKAGGGGEVVMLNKVGLLERTIDRNTSEPWAGCDRCGKWGHQESGVLVQLGGNV